MISYKPTLAACCTCSVSQAVVNNLPALLFIVFNESLGVSLGQLSLLITINFIIQIVIDLTGTFFIDRIGYRPCILVAAALATVGLVSLGVLPAIMQQKFVALVIATVISGVGAGLIEVISSPIVDAIPGEQKAKFMGLLHSFYCWGHALVILLSTLFFALAGIGNWHILPIIWSLAPLSSFILFTFVPIRSQAENGVQSSLIHLAKQRTFWLLIILMICAGASELGMAEWASLFAEKALGVSKAMGDLLGPCTFALCMGVGRLLLSKFGDRLRLDKWLLGSFSLCIVCYLTAALIPNPIVGLIGCAACGIAVAMLWPATLTLGSRRLPGSGTALFALFALAGDIGCTAGPNVIGIISDAITQSGITFESGIFAGDSTTLGMKLGMLFACIFPIIAIIICIILVRMKNKEDTLKIK